MVMAIAKLIRIEKSIFNALSILFPIAYITKNISIGIEYSMPIFCILSAGFIINNINDIERDKVNNPDRVLPKNDISINQAIIWYYFFLAVALLSIKSLIPFDYLFIYLLYLVLMTNYDYVILGHPYFKNLYVVLVASIHFSILYKLTSINIFILIGLIINILCKEIYMDIRDIKGDGNTFAKMFGVKIAGAVILSLQAVLLPLLIMAHDHFLFINYLALGLITITIIWNAFVWTTYQSSKLLTSINIIVVQNFIIYGLIL